MYFRGTGLSLLVWWHRTHHIRIVNGLNCSTQLFKEKQLILVGTDTHFAKTCPRGTLEAYRFDSLDKPCGELDLQINFFRSNPLLPGL